jgi:dethiobiotin synthetase
MAPIDDRHVMRDWIAALGIPAVLVCGSYLGTISHTLTALVALREVGVSVTAAIVAASPSSPVSSEETAEVIARHGGVATRVLPRLAIGADGLAELAGTPDISDLIA